MIRSIIGIIVLVAFSAFFSGSEMAYTAVSEIRLRRLMLSGKKNAKCAHGIYERFREALISILIGNNLVNIAASSVATMAAVAILPRCGAWVSTAVMTVIIVIFGEITPKLFGAKRAELFAVHAAYPIRVFMIITKPVVIAADAFVKLCSPLWKKSATSDAVTEDDLETILETAEDESVIDEDTANLLQDAMDFDDLMAYEIITPRVDMQAIDIDDAKEEILGIIMDTPYTRLPVYRDTPDNIIGFLHVIHCLRVMAEGGEFDLEDMMMKPQFVHKTMPLPGVLSVMRENNCHMVIVTDEYGGTMGLVTMEDVLEELVGDIWDEKDIIDEDFVRLEDGSFEADADIRLEDLFDELELDMPDFDDDNATLGGWAVEMFGAYPEVGDSFEFEGLRFTVRGQRNLRILSMGIEVLGSGGEGTSEDAD